MKSFLIRSLPWYIREILAHARYFYSKRKPPFAGVYARFDEVPPTRAWRASLWIEVCRTHAEKWRRQVGRAIPESSQPSKALLAVLASAIAVPGKPVRILDFGGAGGLDYAQLVAALGDSGETPIRYHVVDIPEACETGRGVWADDPRITFGPDLPAPACEFDVVYGNGSVHYVEDFRGLLSAFAAYNPAYMLFCKVSMHEGASFVRRQVNMGREMEIPQWVFGFGEFTEAMRALGYALTFRGFGEESYNVENYAPPHAAGRTTHLLFRRLPAAEPA